jgi:hypothetical protein
MTVLSINKYLKEQGLQDVKVNFIGGDVVLKKRKPCPLTQLKKGIAKLGYGAQKKKECKKQFTTEFSF